MYRSDIKKVAFFTIFRLSRYLQSFITLCTALILAITPFLAAYLAVNAEFDACFKIARLPRDFITRSIFLNVIFTVFQTTVYDSYIDFYLIFQQLNSPINFFTRAISRKRTIFNVNVDVCTFNILHWKYFSHDHLARLKETVL